MALADDSTESQRQRLARLGKLRAPTIVPPSSALDRATKVQHYLGAEERFAVRSLSAALKLEPGAWVESPAFRAFIDAAISRRAREILHQHSQDMKPQTARRKSAEFFDFKWSAIKSRFYRSGGE